MSRSVIVTGGTGALGRAVVEAFLVNGDQVTVPWIEAREQARMGKEHAAAIERGRLVLVKADVAEDVGARATQAAAGKPDVLVNGVGGFAGGSPVHETGLDVWDRLFRMNLRTAAAMVRAVAPGMVERGRGSILSIASQAVDGRPPGLAAYTATKGAIVVLTQTLQKELGDAGVRVNAVAPGTIDTPANREAMPDADTSSWTPPAEIARVILWLTSDEARAIRGAVVPV